jgi:hypothetical protein
MNLLLEQNKQLANIIFTEEKLEKRIHVPTRQELKKQLNGLFGK